MTVHTYVHTDVYMLLYSSNTKCSMYSCMYIYSNTVLLYGYNVVYVWVHVATVLYFTYIRTHVYCIFSFTVLHMARR